MKRFVFLLGTILSFAHQAFASTYNPCTSAEISAGTCFDCGTTCSARYTETTNTDGSIKGTLHISGSGDMNRFTYTYNDTLERYQSNAPWKNLDRKITNVVVEEGITSVSGFYNHTTLQSVSLPSTLTTIMTTAFQYAESLTDITIPPNVTSIGHAAFFYTAVEYLTVPATYQKKASDTDLFGASALKGLTVEGNAQIDAMTLIKARNLTSIYCEASNESCQALLKDENFGSKIKFYEKSGSQYLYNGKFYNQPSDIFSGNYEKKRIYTVDEANKISGIKNTIKIRYK